MQGNGYGLGVLISAQAFLEAGWTEIGVGDLNEAMVLRRAGITAPIQVCYQPDIQSAAAIAHAPDLQVGTVPSILSLIKECISRFEFHNEQSPHLWSRWLDSIVESSVVCHRH